MKHTILLISIVAALVAAALPERALAVSPDTPSRVKVRKARKGILVVDSGHTARAMNDVNGLPSAGLEYAATLNRAHRAFGDSVRVYSMVVPTAAAYYFPEHTAYPRHDQADQMYRIYDSLDSAVYAVDVFDVLGDHVAEAIYARTDHHWLPLGAFYAAREFARIAGVPFLSMDNYRPRTIHDFVGTMFRFSGDAAVKRHPEEFIYYVPDGIIYRTTYITYRTSKTAAKRGKKRRAASKTKVVGENEPSTGNFFQSFPDGSVASYSTFMGGDARTVTVDTDAANGRRLMIVKDSFGNAVVPCLFGSFERIVVVDYRYFLRNLREFALQNGITDVLFVNNLEHAYNPGTASNINTMLTR